MLAEAFQLSGHGMLAAASGGPITFQKTTTPV
jgi:hypothetical protein